MLPNFLIVGAHKAGTTSLYQYCKEHPEIYMSPLKETNFLAYDEKHIDDTERQNNHFPITSLDEYQRLFSRAADAWAIGEASPAYLHSVVAIEKIKRYVRDARLIVSLRDPVERAYSGYIMAIRNGCASLKTPFYNLNAAWIQNSLYYGSLKRYFDEFDHDQFKIILFGELRDDALDVMRGVYSFLGVDDAYQPNISYRHNPGGIPRNRLFHSMFRVLRRSRLSRKVIPEKLRKAVVRMRDKDLSPPPSLSLEHRFNLRHYFRRDILALQDLIQMDLSSWLSERDGDAKTTRFDSPRCRSS